VENKAEKIQEKPEKRKGNVCGNKRKAQ